MFKKIAIILGITAIIAAAGVYFYYAEALADLGRNALVCNTIDVRYIDSLKIRLIDEQQIRNIINLNESVLGKRTDKIDINHIESVLNAQGEIFKSEVYVMQPGVLNVEITQRKPVIRFENDKESYYADYTGYIFPTINAIPVPIVSGYIPTSFGKEYKGYPPDKEKDWIMSIIELSNYIEHQEYYKKLIGEIYIEQNGDIALLPRLGCRKIIFGESSDIDLKFKKLNAFYRTIIPEEGINKYKTVNLKYNNQIICR